MEFAKVCGQVVASIRADRVEGPCYLLVDLCSPKGERRGDFLVALDQYGAGAGEMVMISQGSSVRQTEQTSQTGVDALIIGIVDLVEANGSVVYDKKQN